MLFEANALASLGGQATPASKLILAAGFQALPVAESATGLIYARARWYDPSTGTFLSPDPSGYADSSNLYAFAGGDPVNGRDPSGELSDDVVFNTVRQNKEEADRKRAEAWCKAYPVECRKSGVRACGLLRAGGGVCQAAIGGAGLVAPEPTMVSKAFGFATLVRGIDNTVAGGLELVTGEQYDTVTGRALYRLLVKSGVDSAKAAKITGWTEAGVDIATTIGAAPSRSVAIQNATQGTAQTNRAVTSALDVQRTIAGITEQVNARLAANPALARTVRSPAEYAAGQGSANMTKAQYGNAVERLIAREIANDPSLRQVIRYVGGPNSPDFVAFGQNCDITTQTMTQIVRHMRRPVYGRDLV